MTMALVDSGVSAQEIKISPAINIPDKHTTAPGQHNRKRMIVMGTVFGFKGYVLKRPFGHMQGFCRHVKWLTGTVNVELRSGCAYVMKAALMIEQVEITAQEGGIV